MVNSRYEKSVFISFFMILVIIFKVNIYKIVSQHFFFDSMRIFEESINNTRTGDIAYDFTSSIYGNMLNILGIDDFIIANIVIGIICNIILYIHILNTCYINKRWIYKYSILSISIIFLNIYTFSISKDLIQFLIYTFIFCLLVSPSLKNCTKIIITSLILIFFSFIFRGYLIGILGIMILVYFNIMNRTSISIKQILTIIGLTIILLTIAKSILPETYYKLLHIREFTNGSRIGQDYANTMILDVLKNNSSNQIIFILNVIINLIRLMFPLELILIGIKYIPFIVYQLMITIGIIKFVKKNTNDKRYKLLISFIVAYYVVASMFEPDFGSAIRHQMSIYIPLQYIILQKKTREEI